MTPSTWVWDSNSWLAHNPLSTQGFTLRRSLSSRGASMRADKLPPAAMDSVRNVACVTVLSPQGELNGELT